MHRAYSAGDTWGSMVGRYNETNELDRDWGLSEARWRMLWQVHSMCWYINNQFIPVLSAATRLEVFPRKEEGNVFDQKNRFMGETSALYLSRTMVRTSQICDRSPGSPSNSQGNFFWPLDHMESSDMKVSFFFSVVRFWRRSHYDSRADQKQFVRPLLPSAST